MIKIKKKKTNKQTNKKKLFLSVNELVYTYGLHIVPA